MRRSGAFSLVLVVVLAVGWLTYTLTVGGRSPQLGLDLQGGTSVVLAPREQASSAQLDQAISIIRRRVDGLGVAEPEIDASGRLHRRVAARCEGSRSRHFSGRSDRQAAVPTVLRRDADRPPGRSVRAGPQPDRAIRNLRRPQWCDRDDDPGPGALPLLAARAASRFNRAHRPPAPARDRARTVWACHRTDT